MTLLDDYEKQYSVLIAEITSQIAQIKLLGVCKLNGRTNSSVELIVFLIVFPFLCSGDPVKCSEDQREHRGGQGVGE